MNSVSKNDFSSGIFSKELYARNDIAEYQKAVKKMLNCYPHKFGGFSNRQGTKYLFPTNDDTTTGARLIPFQFSIDESLVLEFSDGEMRVIKNDAFVQSGGSDYILTIPYTIAQIKELQYVQSADAMYLFNKDLAPQKLVRIADDNWTITAMTFSPSIAAPTGFSGSGSAKYAVTAVADSGEESLALTGTQNPGTAFSWTASAGADYYKIYKDGNDSGNYGYIGVAQSGTSFKEPATLLDPNYAINPPTSDNPFNSTGNYPSTGAFADQRLLFAGTTNKPQNIWGSKVGAFNNMSSSQPLSDEDAFEFMLNSSQINQIKWIAFSSKVIIGTAGSIWVMSKGRNANTITPSSVDLKQDIGIGVSDLSPLVIDNYVLYTDSTGENVNIIYYDYKAGGYVAKSLSALSKDLFRGYTIKRWAYQNKPNSIVWAVRNDGALLGLTLDIKSGIFGWHLHKTDGVFDDVISLKNANGDDDIYFTIKRIIEGTEHLYIEKLTVDRPLDSLFEFNAKDGVFMDASVSLDNPVDITDISSDTETIITSAGHGLNDGDYIEIDDVYYELDFNGDVKAGIKELNGKRLVVSDKTTDTFKVKDFNGNYINGSNFDYVKGGVFRLLVDTISGLDHLEGKTLSILADGSYVADKVVSSGSVTLDYKAGRIHAGLPYYSELETLDFVVKGGFDKMKSVPSVMLYLQDTRAIMLGTEVDNVVDVPFRTDEAYGDPTRMYTGFKEIFPIAGQRRENSIYIKNIYPLPMTVLSMTARVKFGDR